MTFSTAEIILIIGALAAAISQIIQQWRTGSAVKENTALTHANGLKSDTIAQKADVLIGKTVEIHDLTNSNLEKVKQDLQLAKNEIAELRLLVAAMTKP